MVNHMQNKMKLQDKRTGIIALFMVSLLTIPVVTQANNSTHVTITGKVLANTCIVKPTTEWVMNDVKEGDFSQKGSTKGTQNHNIELTGCGASARSVDMTINGTMEEGVLINNAPANKATGVGFSIKHDAKVINDSFKKNIVLEASKDKIIPFTVEYKAIVDSVKSGNILSTMTVTFDYL